MRLQKRSTKLRIFFGKKQKYPSQSRFFETGEKTLAVPLKLQLTLSLRIKQSVCLDAAITGNAYSRSFGLPARKGWALEKTRYRLAPTVGSLRTLLFSRLRHSLFEIGLIISQVLPFVKGFFEKKAEIMLPFPRTGSP